MNDRKEMTRQINRLYLKLGKTLYKQMLSGKINQSELKKQCKIISKEISKIKKMSKEYNYNNDSNDKNDKVTLLPQENEDGIKLYVFCKKCRVGNNPNSTHCIQCGSKL